MGNIVKKEFEEKVKSLKDFPPDQGLQELTRWAVGAQVQWELEEANRPPWRRPSRFRTAQEYRDQ